MRYFFYFHILSKVGYPKFTQDLMLPRSGKVARKHWFLLLVKNYNFRFIKTKFNSRVFSKNKKKMSFIFCASWGEFKMILKSSIEPISLKKLLLHCIPFSSFSKVETKGVIPRKKIEWFCALLRYFSFHFMEGKIWSLRRNFKVRDRNICICKCLRKANAH